jgi:leucyl-tRNA synthetase
MRQQLKQLGLSYDWDREVATCAPDYYKWTQWIFIQMLNMGLAYQREAAVNWDPIDQTVLANEQVDSEGRSWRSGCPGGKENAAPVVPQNYRLRRRIAARSGPAPGWPERVKLMQANWIGKSTGARVVFTTETGEEAASLYHPP